MTPAPSPSRTRRPPASPTATPVSEEPTPLPAQRNGERPRGLAGPMQRLRGWLAHPLPERARRAPVIAQWANELAAKQPDNPNVQRMQRELPGLLKGEALSALDGRRARLAELFYRAYNSLTFAKPDPELDRRFARLTPRPQ